MSLQPERFTTFGQFEVCDLTAPDIKSNMLRLDGWGGKVQHVPLIWSEVALCSCVATPHSRLAHVFVEHEHKIHLE